MSRRIIGILGPDHGGSTMLGAMIGSSRTWAAHPHVGEFHAFATDIPAAKQRKCAFGDAPCAVWAGFDKSHPKPHHHFMDLHGCSTLVDSSKNTTWFDAVPADIAMDFVYVWRDPAAIHHSYQKRFAPWEAELRYARQIVSVQSDLRWLKKREATFVAVSLESLLRKPAEGLRKLCEELRLDYFPGKEEFWNFEHHHFAGARSVKQALRDPAEASLRPPSAEESPLQVEMKAMLRARARLLI